MRVDIGIKIGLLVTRFPCSPPLLIPIILVKVPSHSPVLSIPIHKLLALDKVLPFVKLRMPSKVRLLLKILATIKLLLVVSLLNLVKTLLFVNLIKILSPRPVLPRVIGQLLQGKAVSAFVEENLKTHRKNYSSLFESGEMEPLIPERAQGNLDRGLID